MINEHTASRAILMLLKDCKHAAVFGLLVLWVGWLVGVRVDDKGSKGTQKGGDR
jgi:hypothetical protein